jgi:hypothetical protein
MQNQNNEVPSLVAIPAILLHGDLTAAEAHMRPVLSSRSQLLVSLATWPIGLPNLREISHEASYHPTSWTVRPRGTTYHSQSRWPLRSETENDARFAAIRVALAVLRHSRVPSIRAGRQFSGPRSWNDDLVDGPDSPDSDIRAGQY